MKPLTLKSSKAKGSQDSKRTRQHARDRSGESSDKPADDSPMHVTQTEPVFGAVAMTTVDGTVTQSSSIQSGESSMQCGDRDPHVSDGSDGAETVDSRQDRDSSPSLLISQSQEGTYTFAPLTSQSRDFDLPPRILNSSLGKKTISVPSPSLIRYEDVRPRMTSNVQFSNPMSTDGQ